MTDTFEPAVHGKVLVVMLSAETETAHLIERECRARGLATTFLAAEYDYVDGKAFAGLPLRLPMDYLSPESLDPIYHAVYGWQEGLAAKPLSDGTPIGTASSPEGFDPALPGWILRLAPHYHVRARFIEMISAALDAEAPTLVCPVGRSRYQPWNVTLLERVVNQRADIHLVPAVGLLPYSAQWELAMSETSAVATMAASQMNPVASDAQVERLERNIEILKAKRLELRRDQLRRNKQARRDLRSIGKEKRQAIRAQTRALEVDARRLAQISQSLEATFSGLAIRAENDDSLAGSVAACQRLMDEQRRRAKAIEKELSRCNDMLEQLRSEAGSARGRSRPADVERDALEP